MTALHLPSFIWGALLGPVLWITLLVVLLAAITLIGVLIERLAS